VAEPASPHANIPSITTHSMMMTEDKQESGKYRYRVCKVCSILQTSPIGNSRAYCADCSTEKARVYLCDRIRNTEAGNQLTCFQIWHQVWENGTLRGGDRKIRLRTFKESISNRRESSASSASFKTRSQRSMDFTP
jgi:hypothetical protein